jgi:hypothetical protein
MGLGSDSVKRCISTTRLIPACLLEYSLQASSWGLEYAFMALTNLRIVPESRNLGPSSKRNLSNSLLFGSADNAERCIGRKPIDNLLQLRDSALYYWNAPSILLTMLFSTHLSFSRPSSTYRHSFKAQPLASKRLCFELHCSRDLAS